jgi:hypothetical protein
LIRWTIDTNVATLSRKLTSNAVDYFYIKITQENHDEAILSPIRMADTSEATASK